MSRTPLYSPEAARRELGGIVERMGLVPGEAALPTLLADYDRLAAAPAPADLVRALIEAFEAKADVRDLVGDPDANGVRVCITHLQDYLDHLTKEDAR